MVNFDFAGKLAEKKITVKQEAMITFEFLNNQVGSKYEHASVTFSSCELLEINNWDVNGFVQTAFNHKMIENLNILFFIYIFIWLTFLLS